MKTILTLVGNPADKALFPAMVAEVRTALQDASAQVQGPDWLGPQVACDLEFEGIEKALAESLARKVLGNAPIDVLAQSTLHRRKKLLIADMDATMITVECLDELADYAGKKAEVSAITERAMRGELDFEDALRKRVLMLAGLEEAVLAAVLSDRIELTPGGAALVRTMNANGAMTILVSGGFRYFTSRIAQTIGFGEHRGNELCMEDGKLTGEVGSPILGRDAKRATLNAARKRLSLSAEETLAVGDGANDLDMLKDAGLGVAYHAKPIVAEAARARVDHGDLTALLYFQGYRNSEFVSV